jgi:hypothetical protein
MYSQDQGALREEIRDCPGSRQGPILCFSIGQMSPRLRKCDGATERRRRAGDYTRYDSSSKRASLNGLEPSSTNRVG